MGASRIWKAILWLMPLLFMWLLIVYATYPLTHQNYVLDFPSMITRFSNAFDTTLYTWFDDMKEGLSADLQNMVDEIVNMVSGWSSSVWSGLLGLVSGIFKVFYFGVVFVFKALLYYPTTLLVYLVAFLVKLFDVIFNPSFIDISSLITVWQ